MPSDEHEYHVERKIQALNEAEYKTLQGKTFSVTGVFTGVSDGATNYVHFVTGDRPVNIRADSTSTGSLVSRLYEDQGSMDVTTDGTDKEPVALNRANNESLSGSLAFNEGPTVNNTGTVLLNEVGGGSKGGLGPNDSAPGVTAPTFITLAPNTEYLLELEDSTSDTQTEDIGYGFTLFESKFDF